MISVSPAPLASWLSFTVGTADILSAAGLSPREKEVAMLLRQCPTVAEIAERLRISRKTAATHLGRIYMKLGSRGKRDVLTRLFQENTYF